MHSPSAKALRQSIGGNVDMESSSQAGEVENEEELSLIFDEL